MSDSPAQRKKAAAGVSLNVANRDRAAILLAEDEMRPLHEQRRSQQAIADEIGVSRKTISRWRADPEFMAMVQDAKGKIVADALRLPSAQKHQRIRNLDEIAEDIRRVFALRGQRYQLTADTPEEAARQVFGSRVPPEAATGLLIEKQKIAASGKTVTDWELDTSGVKTLIDIYKHIAQETGQLDQTLNVHHDGEVSIAVSETVKRLAEQYGTTEAEIMALASEGDE